MGKHGYPTDFTGKGGGARSPNSSVIADGHSVAGTGGPSANEQDVQPHVDTGQPSAPPGTVDVSQRRQSFQPGGVMATPSMSGPAATRPRKATNESITEAEASFFDDSE